MQKKPNGVLLPKKPISHWTDQKKTAVTGESTLTAFIARPAGVPATADKWLSRLLANPDADSICNAPAIGKQRPAYNGCCRLTLPV